MPSAAASSTSVGARSPGRAGLRSGGGGGGGGGVRQRRGGGAASGGAVKRSGASNTGGMWRFYTDDSPGIKVGPVPVLVMSLLFIASVFMLHIWGKYTRG